MPVSAFFKNCRRRHFVFTLFLSSLFLFSFFIFNSKVQAQEIRENYINARAAGMGNAFSAVVDDHNALFYNPAALDRVKGFHLALVGLQVGTDAIDAFTNYQNATSSNYATIIQQFYGKQIWMGLADCFAFSMSDFGFAGFDFLNLSFILHNPAYSNVTLTVTNDNGIVTGFALPLIPDILRFGIAFKRVTRYGGSLKLGPGTVASLSNAYLTSLLNNYGIGYGADAAFLLEAPGGVHPALTFVWQNIGQTFFVPSVGSVAPPPMDNNVTLGFSSTFDLPMLKIRPAIDFQHMTLAGEQIGMLLHMGVELEFSLFSIRGGVNQGYYTAGASINLKYFSVDFATYGTELGAYAGQTEDRRYIASLTIDLSFDPHFDFSSSGANGGSKYRAFQRR